MHSAIYKGIVWHKRRLPGTHAFRYKVFMMYLDLAEVDQVLALSRFWSTSRLALARFKRSDFFSLAGEAVQSATAKDEIKHLDTCVRQAVAAELKFYPQGPIRLLTNLRYFGYIINPISCYYCFAKGSNETLQALLIQVTNTPWEEKTHYVLDLRDYSPAQIIKFQKDMHVSPFMPMQMMYHWRGLNPGHKLQYTLANVPFNSSEGERDVKDADTPGGKATFMAGVNFTRLDISAANLNKIILQYPFMTLKVAAAIYWQALRLAFNKVPFIAHPDAGRS